MKQKRKVIEATARMTKENSFLTEAWIRHALDALKREEHIEAVLAETEPGTGEHARLTHKLTLIREEQEREKLGDAIKLVEQHGEKARKMIETRRRGEAMM